MKPKVEFVTHCEVHAPWLVEAEQAATNLMPRMVLPVGAERMVQGQAMPVRVCEEPTINCPLHLTPDCVSVPLPRLPIARMFNALQRIVIFGRIHPLFKRS